MHIEQKMVDFVIDLLKEHISDNFYYHDVAHTLYVMRKVVEIGRAEKCNDEEIRLLETAALWHDTGYINIYFGHEEESCKLAQKYLPDYYYSNNEIEKICGMIMATKIPHDPLNKFEEIIADADLFYLGTEQAGVLANNLFKELQRLNTNLTPELWKRTEINFLKSHKYFTAYCRLHSEPGKLLYFNKLLASKK